MKASPPSVSGALASDQTWGGKILLGGDLVVPAGVTLTLAPGAVVEFSRETNFHSPETRIWRGKDRAVNDRYKCSMLVRGRLIARGTAEAPIAIGGEREWGGLHFFGSGRGELARAAISSAVSEGVALWDESKVSLDDCVLTGCWSGVGTAGAARAVLRGCRISGMRESGLLLDGGSVRAEDTEILENAVADVAIGRGASAELRGCRLKASKAGVSAEGPAAIVGAELSGHAECGFDLRSGEHRLESVKIAGTGTGLRIAGAGVEAKDLEADCARAAAIVWSGGRLRWTGGLSRGAAVGVEILGGEARLEDMELAGGGQGVRLEGGAFSASRLRAGGQSAACVSLLEAGTAEIADGEFKDAPVGVVSKGARLSLARSSFSGHAQAALSLSGDGHELDGVGVRGSLDGVIVESGRVLAKDLALACGRYGAAVRSGAFLEWKDGSTEGGTAGIFVEGGRLEAFGVDIRGGEQGLRLEAGEASVAGLRISGQRDACVNLLEKGSAELSGCRLEGAPAGIVTKGARLSLDGCELEGHSHCGVELRGAGHRLARVRVKAGAAGVIIENGAAQAEDLAAECEGTGVSVRSGAELSWENGASIGGDVGVKVDGGRLTSRGLRVSGQSAACVSLLASGSAELADSEFRDAPVGIATKGALLASSGCSFAGFTEAAFDLRGEGHRLERASVRNSRVGLVVENGAAEARGLELACSKYGVVARERARVILSSAASEGGEAGLVVAGGRIAAIESSCRGGAEGLRLESGEFEGRGLKFDAQGAACVHLLEKGTAVLSDCEAADAPVGIASEGAKLTLAACRLSGFTESAVDLLGAGHQLARVEISRSRAGVRLARGEATLESVCAECAECAVSVGAGGRLRWKSGAWRGGAVGLAVYGGEAEVQAVEGSGAGQGIRLEGGSLKCRSARLRENSDIGVSIAAGAKADLADCLIDSSGVGVLCQGGRLTLSGCSLVRCSIACCSLEGGSHVIEGCRFDPACKDVRLAGGALVRRDGETGTRGAGLRAAILRLVLMTRGLRPLRAIYHRMYSAAVEKVAAWARAEPSVRSALVHRGWVTGDWEPGISDLDFIVTSSAISGEDGARWLEAFWETYARWKKKLPFLGEILIAAPAELDAYLARGGARAAEIRSRSRAIAGAAPDGKSEAPSRLALLGECAHAYTRLMQWTCEPGRFPQDTVRVQVRKSLIDLLRYSPGTASETVPTRREFAAGKGADGWREILGSASIEPAPLVARGLKFFHEAARSLDAPAASSPGFQWVKSLSAASPPAELAARRARGAERIRACFGGAARLILLDDLYRSYIVLDDAAAESEALPELIASWLNHQRLEPMAETMPMLLSRRSWSVWRCLPYLDSPLRSLEFGAESDAETAWSGAGSWLRGSFQYRWGRDGAGTPPRGLVREAALESAANLGLTWRLMGAGGSPVSASYAVHYLFSRSLGLRLLLEKDVGASFFDLDGILALAREHFPEVAPALERVRPQDGLPSARRVFYENYAFLEDQISRLAALR